MGQTFSAFHLLFVIAAVGQFVTALAFLPGFREEGERPAGTLVREFFLKGA
jgi:hypothetical protein